MHYAAAEQHNGRKDEHGHLWAREPTLFCWRCDDCGRKLHGVKAIWLDAKNRSSCNEREGEPSIHLHETVEGCWEEWRKTENTARSHRCINGCVDWSGRDVKCYDFKINLGMQKRV